MSKRHSSVVSASYSPSIGDTEIALVYTKVLCINTVTVDGVAQYKYKDYDIDLRNNKIIFLSPFAGTETVLVSYDYNTSGISWINPSNPERDRSSALTRTDYPRVIISDINFSGEFIGFNSDKQNNTSTLQIDIATKDGLECTDYVRIKTDGTSETISESSQNANTVDHLALGIVNAIKRKWRDEMKHKFYPAPNMFKGETAVTIDHDIGLFRKAIDIQISGFDLGEYS
ncbi:MAG: hypothetical protein ACOYWZ_17380 [Bacillota bacterium]